MTLYERLGFNLQDPFPLLSGAFNLWLGAVLQETMLVSDQVTASLADIDAQLMDDDMNAELYMIKGLLHWCLNQQDEAEAALILADFLRSKDPQVSFLFGLVLTSKNPVRFLGNASMEQAAELQPNRIEPWFWLIYHLLQRDNIQQALQLANTVVAGKLGNDLQREKLAGWFFTKAADIWPAYNQEVANFFRMLAQKPDMVRVYKLLRSSVAYRLLVDMHRTALALDPKFPAAAIELIRLYMTTNDSEQASKVFQALVASQELDAVQSVIHLFADSLSGSRDLMTQALEMSADQEILARLFNVYYLLKDKENAIKVYTRYHDQAPEHPLVDIMALLLQEWE